MSEQILYTREDAAIQLATTPRQIDELRRSGRLIAVQMGRKFKYRHADLAEYADRLPTSVEVAS